MTLRIGVIVGSLRAGSINRRVATALVRLGEKRATFSFIEIGDLPLYNQDEEAEPVPSVVRVKEAIRACDGVIFVTPEYNRSIPGVLKNAIDHASRPYGDSAWTGRTAGVVGASTGKIGTATAQQHLRNVLAYLDMPTLGQPEAFVQWTDGLLAGDGGIGPDGRDFLQGWMDRFLVLTERQRAG